MDEKKPLLSAESTLTDRYQTTIPEVVRKALGLGKRDRLEFLLDEAGGITVRKAAPPEEEAEHTDPTLAGFLDLLAKDIDENPQKLIELDDSFFSRWQKIIDLFGSDQTLPPYDPDEHLEKEEGDSDDWLNPAVKK